MSDVARLLAGDPDLFAGPTASRALGWLRHPEVYGGAWIDETARRLPRRHERTIVVGMGGSSSPARLLNRVGEALEVLDTSNPDSVAATDFAGATVVAASKSGTTIEVQTLLAHALVSGLEPEDLVVVTDPGTTLAALGASLGATVVLGDPRTGGRYSALSPFGLVPALYAGWSAADLGDLLRENALDEATAARALARAEEVELHEGWGTLTLDGDPALDGAALWLEQLVAETTGKQGRGVVPLAGAGPRHDPGRIMEDHLTAVWLARRLGVDPFDQPDVDGAKRSVFARLGASALAAPAGPEGACELAVALAAPGYRTLQIYGPLAIASQIGALRAAVAARFGPTTANLGPRYLHSTGQLHKGGPALGAVQVLVRPQSTPRRIQGRRYTFHDLHRAQADADLAALVARGRPVARVEVDDLAEATQRLVAAS